MTVNFSLTQITDAGLVHLTELTNTQTLYLWSTPSTDQALAHLKGMTNLQTLSLGSTQITDAGFAELQKALPNCEIYRK